MTQISLRFRIPCCKSISLMGRGGIIRFQTIEKMDIIQEISHSELFPKLMSVRRPDILYIEIQGSSLNSPCYVSMTITLKYLPDVIEIRLLRRQVWKLQLGDLRWLGGEQEHCPPALSNVIS